MDRRSLPAVGAAISLSTVYVAVLAIPLGIAGDLGLDRTQTASWILGIYGLAGVLTLVLVARHRLPLLVTGNIFILLFISLLGGAFSWPEYVGAAMAAGVVVLVLGVTGLLAKLARLLPAPVVYGVLAATVVGFFVRVFDIVAAEPWIVGTAVVAWLVARWLVEPAVPAIFVALVAGLAAAWATGSISGSLDWSWAAPALTGPTFSADALLTLTPIMVVLITVQANAPSLVVLHREGYDPPARLVDLVSGSGTTVGALFGPMGVSLSLPATALIAGPDAGDRDVRHHGAYVAGAVSLLIAAGAWMAADLIEVLPAAYLVTVFGLATIPVFIDAVKNAFGSGMVIGPAFAFAITLSDLEVAGLQPLFWALAVGVGVSALLERDAWPTSAV